MEPNAFDRVARDYVKIHDRSLPPGVHSDDFVAQRARNVIAWIRQGYRKAEYCYLDFGCGNGRMFKLLIESDELGPLLAEGRLRLFGFDTSVESLREARTLVGDERIRLVSDLADLPGGIRFDLVVSFNVFHHIAPAERPAAVRTLHARMKPGARLVIWEHNPFNPLTRMLVRLCPFDGDARLLTLSAARTLLGGSSYRYLRHAYVNVFPPRWQQWKLFSAIEERLINIPAGAQYWAMFARDE